MTMPAEFNGMREGDPVSLDGDIVGYLIIDGGKIGVRTPHGSEIVAGFVHFATRIKAATEHDLACIALLEHAAKQLAEDRGS